MSAFEGSVARSFDQFPQSVAGSAERAEGAWTPTQRTESPALDLQRQVRASVVENPFPELPVHPADQLLRVVSRGAGYVSLAAAVALIGWLVV